MQAKEKVTLDNKQQKKNTRKKTNAKRDRQSLV